MRREMLKMRILRGIYFAPVLCKFYDILIRKAQGSLRAELRWRALNFFDKDRGGNYKNQARPSPQCALWLFCRKQEDAMSEAKFRAGWKFAPAGCVLGTFL